MADKVVRINDVERIESSTPAGAVVLKVSGRVAGKKVRVEIRLCPYSMQDAVKKLREGAKYHASVWTDTTVELGKGNG